MVSLLIGVNDQFQFNDTTGYRLRFTQLLLKAIELANNKPIACICTFLFPITA